MRSERARTLAATRLADMVRRQGAQIAKFKGLVTEYDGAFWKHVTEVLETRLRKIERDREDRVRQMSHVEIVAATVQETEIKEFIRLPETAKAMVTKMLEDHAAAREQLRKLKQGNL